MPHARPLVQRADQLGSTDSARRNKGKILLNVKQAGTPTTKVTGCQRQYKDAAGVGGMDGPAMLVHTAAVDVPHLAAADGIRSRRPPLEDGQLPCWAQKTSNTAGSAAMATVQAAHWGVRLVKSTMQACATLHAGKGSEALLLVAIGTVHPGSVMMGYTVPNQNRMGVAPDMLCGGVARGNAKLLPAGGGANDGAVCSTRDAHQATTMSDAVSAAQVAHMARIWACHARRYGTTVALAQQSSIAARARTRAAHCVTLRASMATMALDRCAGVDVLRCRTMNVLRAVLVTAGIAIWQL